jgi:hypothetical protein
LLDAAHMGPADGGSRSPGVHEAPQR